MTTHLAPKRFLLLTAAWITIATSAAIAQTGAASPAAKPITFETISIRSVKSNITHGDNFTADGYSMRGITAFSLLTFYLENPGERIIGTPDWVMREQYDIEAKVADTDVAAWGKLDFKHRKLAIYALLGDRFKLVVHHEIRELPGYALVIAKNGPKLKEATPGDTYPKGFKGLGSEPLLGVLMETGPGVISAQAITMAQLAGSLGGPAGRPVIDKTGLTGKYDFTLKVDAPPATRGPAPVTAEPASAASEPSGPSIFTVLPEQLGLKLESGATVPVDYIIVDHIERPSEN
jgi:uncharacterized protein (TIGR03435 family)